MAGGPALAFFCKGGSREFHHAATANQKARAALQPTLARKRKDAAPAAAAA